jgi:hypothetical protein
MRHTARHDADQRASFRIETSEVFEDGNRLARTLHHDVHRPRSDETFLLEGVPGRVALGQ